MNIIHIITSLESGGTEKNLFNFIKFDKKNNHIVFVLKPYGFFQEEMSSRVKVFSPKKKGLLFFFKFIFYIKKFCYKNYQNTDLILSWNYQTNLISTILKGKKKIWQIRSSGEKIFSSIKRIFYVLINGILSVKADKIIFNSYKSKNFHQNFFLNKKIYVIQNGFFNQKIKKIKKIKKGEKIKYLCIARKDYYKDHSTLIKSFLLFDKKFKDWNLYLLGKESQFILEDLNLEKDFIKKIIFINETKNIHKYISKCHFHILASLGESFPNVIGETMSCGLLNIATDVGDINFMIKNKSFLSISENPQSLARRLLYSKNLLINNFNDYLKHSISAKKHIEQNYNYEKFFSNIIEHIKEACQKKFLFVLPTLNSGGAERVTTEIMNKVEFCKNVKDVDLLILGKKTKKDYKKIFNGNIIYLNFKKTFSSFFALRRFLNSKNYDFIFSNIPNVNTLLNIIKISTLKKFFLIVRETNMPDQPLIYNFNLKNFINYLLRFSYFFSDLIVSPSQEIHKLLKKMLIFKDKKRFIYLPNYIDKSMYQNLSKKKENIKLPKNFILNISNIKFQKNLEMLIEIFKNIHFKNKKFKLLIIGKVIEKKYYNKIIEKIKKFKLQKKIIFLGYQSNPFSIIKKAKLILSTSRWEGMPNNILHSLALNKLVVSTNCKSGPYEIKKYGFSIKLFEFEKVKQFSNFVLKNLENKKINKIDNSKFVILYNDIFNKGLKNILKFDA